MHKPKEVLFKKQVSNKKSIKINLFKKQPFSQKLFKKHFFKKQL